MTCDDLKKNSFQLYKENASRSSALSEWTWKTQETLKRIDKMSLPEKTSNYSISNSLDSISRRWWARLAKWANMTLRVEIHQRGNHPALRAAYDMPRWMYHDAFANDVYEVLVINPFTEIFGKPKSIAVGVFETLEGAKRYVEYEHTNKLHGTLVEEIELSF